VKNYSQINTVNKDRKNKMHKKIVFFDISPQISDEAFLAFYRALNKRRPWTSKDSIPVPFIDDMNQNIR